MKYVKYFAITILLTMIAFEGAFYTAIAGVGISRIIEFIFFLPIAKYFLNDVKNNRVLFVTVQLLIIFGLLLSLKLFTVVIVDGEDNIKILINIVRLLFFIFPTYIVYYLLREKNIDVIKFILLLNFPIILLAFFQSEVTPYTDIAWQIKYDFFPEGLQFDNEFFRKRVVGVYFSSIPLAYTLSVDFVLTTYLYIKTKSNLYTIYFLFLGIVSVFSLTRSVVLSWAVMFIYYIYHYLRFKTSILNKVFGITIIILFVVYGSLGYMENSDSLDRVTSTKGSSAQGRLPLALTGIYTLVMHPFGVSESDYNDAKKEMYAVFHVEDILNFPSHNGLLNIGFEYTTFGLMVFLVYLYALYKILKNNFSKDMKLFFIVSFFVYLTNSFFHNNFIFIQNFYAFIILSIFAYEFDLQTKRRTIL